MPLRKTSVALFLLVVVCFCYAVPTSGESELTTVMKTLLQWMRQERALILEDHKHQHFAAISKKVATAQITEGKKKADEHAQYAAEMVTALKQYQKAKGRAARTEQFNLVVGSCIKCHEHECPGPIFTIKTLRIK